MHNRKPISKDAIDDQCHFPVQWLAGFCSCHFLPAPEWTEIDLALQMGSELQLSMAVQPEVTIRIFRPFSRTSISHKGGWGLPSPSPSKKTEQITNLTTTHFSEKMHTCPAERQRLHASSILPALNNIQTSSRRDSSCFYECKKVTELMCVYIYSRSRIKRHSTEWAKQWYHIYNPHGWFDSLHFYSFGTESTTSRNENMHKSWKYVHKLK